jgi:hypothetical protein
VQVAYQGNSGLHNKEVRFPSVDTEVQKEQSQRKMKRKDKRFPSVDDCLVGLKGNDNDQVDYVDVGIVCGNQLVYPSVIPSDGTIHLTDIFLGGFRAGRNCDGTELALRV